MAATMTASQRRTGDAISDFAGRAAWVYLAAGILSVLFGAVVLSLVLDWVGLYTVALFVGIFLISWGVLHILAALLDQPAHWVWHVLGGALSVAAGALAIGWPDVTLFVLVEIIGWSLIVWGLLDLLSAFATYGMRHWWLYLIRGFASIALGFLALGRENVTLYFVVTLLAAFEWPVRVDRPYRLEVRVIEEDERRILTEAVVLDAKQRPCVTARAEMAVLSPAQAVDALGVEPGAGEERYLR